MTIAENYQSINQAFNELRNLLVTKLHNCYVEKATTDSFTELIEAVGEIQANEVIHKGNVAPTNMPQIDTSDISKFNTTIYQRIRYYMKLLGYFLVLKGVSVELVNNQTDLKGLIELIDNIHVIKPTYFTIGSVDELQYYGTDINVPYTLKDIDNQDVTEGYFIIQDEDGATYASMQAGQSILISPSYVSEKINGEYQLKTFTITYNGSDNFFPSEPQTFSVRILPAQIRLSLTMTNMNTKSKYYKQGNIGSSGDDWYIVIKTYDYLNRPLSNIPFRFIIPNVLSVENQTDEDGLYIINQAIEQPRNYAITCETLYESEEEMAMSNTNLEYNVQIKYNIIGQRSEVYTDYAGKINYTFTVDIINEDTGRLDAQYNNHTMKVFMDDVQIGTVIINDGHASYTLNNFAIGEKNLTWTLEEPDFTVSSVTQINIISNFILPTQQKYFLNDTPEIIYAPNGEPANNNTINGVISYIDIDETTYTEQITLTTDSNGKITTLSNYRNPGNYTISLSANNNINENISFEYQLKQPFVIDMVKYSREKEAIYNIIFYKDGEYDISLTNNAGHDRDFYTITEVSDEPYRIVNFTMVTDEQEDIGLSYILSVEMDGYTDSVKFKLDSKVFTVLTSSVGVGEDTIEVKCEDDSIEDIYIESEDIDVIDISKNNDTFTVEAIFKKAGLIEFDVIDEELSVEKLNIQVNKYNLSNNVETKLYVDKQPSTDNNILYTNEDKALFFFDIDKIIYSDLNISYIITKNNQVINTENFIYYADTSNNDYELGISNLTPDNYQAKFIFNGDENYTSFSKVVDFTIKKPLPDVEITAYSAYDVRPIGSSANQRLEKDDNADLIFKEGNYVNTYVIVKADYQLDYERLSDAVFYLVDENDNPLYSPYSSNREEIKTKSNIIVGEENALALPAHYITSNEWVDFEAGIYHWKIKYDGDDIYDAYEEPFDVEIRNFNICECEDIFPNESLSIRLRTYIDTVNENAPDISNIPQHDNAQYNSIEGILTLPEADKSIGKHTLTFDYYVCTYNVKNPIAFYSPNPLSLNYSSGIYRYNLEVGCEALTGAMYERSIGENLQSVKCNGQELSRAFLKGANEEQGKKYAYITHLQYPPGIYNCEVTGNTTTCPGSYTVTGVIEITTEDCSIDLSFDYDTNILTATYLYDGNIPIPNATIQISKEDGTFIATGTTDSNGQISTLVGNDLYYAEVLDNYTYEVLLTSNFSGDGYLIDYLEIWIDENGNIADVDGSYDITYWDTDNDIEDISKFRTWRVLFR